MHYWCKHCPLMQIFMVQQLQGAAVNFLMFSFPVMTPAIIMTRGARHLNTLLLGQNWVTMCLLTVWHLLEVHSPCVLIRSTRAWRAWATAARWWRGWWAATTTSSSPGASSTSAPPSRSAHCRLLQTPDIAANFLLSFPISTYVSQTQFYMTFPRSVYCTANKIKNIFKIMNPASMWQEAVLPEDHIKIVSDAWFRKIPLWFCWAWHISVRSLCLISLCNKVARPRDRMLTPFCYLCNDQ